MTSNIVNKYLHLKEFPVDEQLLLYSGDELIKKVSIDVLLSQFKYCINHNVKSEAFTVLKNHLILELGENVVDELGVVHVE